MLARLGLVSAVLLAATAANAQERVECEENGWWGWRNGPRGHVCEVRELTVPADGVLTVDAGPNGSIGVKGESRRDVQVRATVHAWGRDEAEAERIVSAVNVRSDGTVRADGPDQGGRAGWSVSYEILAPREIDLNVETRNGSIAVADVRGNLVLEAQNGSLNLDAVAGNVRGRTTNGGVDAELTGDSWQGTGLDLETTNGGVRLRIPENYSARLETATVNGGIDIDFPVTVQGRLGREFSTTLGDGGPLVRAETTNGQVRITRGRGNLTRLPAN
jgi:hypothetical protein